MERGGLCFPRDYPDTDAFNDWALVMFALQRQRYFSRLSIFCVSVYVWCLCLSVRVSACIPICVRTTCRGARQRRVSEAAARPLDRTRGSRGGNRCRAPTEVRNLRSAFRAVCGCLGGCDAFLCAAIASLTTPPKTLEKTCFFQNRQIVV